MKKTFITAITLLASAVSNNAIAETEQRIISVGSTATEIIYALNKQDTLVAVDFSSRHQTAGSDIPEVGYHRQLSAEGLLSLAPDTIVGSAEMGPASTINTLKSAGVDVREVSTGNDSSDLLTRIDEVATLTHAGDEANLLKATVSNRFNALEENQPAQAPKTVFVMLAEGRPMTVAGENTPVNSIITLAGGINPAQAQFDSYKPMSIEAIIEMQPDYILVAERSWEAMGELDGILKKIPLLAATPAGSEQRIIPVRSAAIINGFGLQSLDLAETLQHAFVNGTAK
ncbi:heme/hemin ABC transporter substrate-binding protein [Thaumasiovibrio subtropicus]|uniref:heme/hemin ABC transporter substrate-binding protein n=1 Tax=Thaumasiovibrio subtropicus TaxID=1891207 RepID=UPI000B35E99D|nr:ABC transporter substrate-binding protein [Thaumasiovibrio subtropicus]